MSVNTLFEGGLVTLFEECAPSSGRLEAKVNHMPPEGERRAGMGVDVAIGSGN